MATGGLGRWSWTTAAVVATLSIAIGVSTAIYAVFNYALLRPLQASDGSQGLVSLDSICHLEPSRKPAMKAVIQKQVNKRELVLVEFEGSDSIQHWMKPELVGAKIEINDAPKLKATRPSNKSLFSTLYCFKTM